MQVIAGPESAFDAPLFPTNFSHLCCHQRAGWGRQNWVCPRARETLGTPLSNMLAFLHLVWDVLTSLLTLRVLVSTVIWKGLVKANVVLPVFPCNTSVPAIHRWSCMTSTFIIALSNYENVAIALVATHSLSLGQNILKRWSRCDHTVHWSAFGSWKTPSAPSAYHDIACTSVVYVAGKVMQADDVTISFHHHIWTLTYFVCNCPWNAVPCIDVPINTLCQTFLKKWNAVTITETQFPQKWRAKQPDHTDRFDCNRWVFFIIYSSKPALKSVPHQKSISRKSIAVKKIQRIKQVRSLSSTFYKKYCKFIVRNVRFVLDVS